MKRLTLSILMGAALTASPLAFADASEAEFIKNFDKAFSDSCTSQGAPADLCQCALTKIKANVSYKQLKSMEDGTATEAEQKEILEKLISATMECTPK